MKYLEANPPAPVTENKMQTGTRSDQKGDRNVQQLATELGVDLSTVKGSGANGAVTKNDVMKAASPEKLAPSTSSAPK